MQTLSYLWHAVQNPILYALPVFFVTIAIEVAFFAREVRQERGKGYLAIDTRTSLTMGLGALVFMTVFKLATLVLFVFLWVHLAPWHIPAHAWWSWVLLAVIVDLVEGQPHQRASLLGQVHDLTATTRVVEFNDLDALAAALAPGDVACVLAEPVMTNIGMVLPEPGFWTRAIELIHRHGSLLVMDETHTISSGPGGYARAHGLRPDAVVVGKPLGGGMPCALPVCGPLQGDGTCGRHVAVDYVSVRSYM